MYFDSSTIVGSQDYYNKSLMMILVLGLAGVLFCENE